jgi:putative membrane protein insertion efficiency factor
VGSWLRMFSSLLPRVYHDLVSPLLPAACRFHPTCSIYLANAIQKYGLVKGAWLGLCRLARCRPAHPGGYDPVK